MEVIPETMLEAPEQDLEKDLEKDIETNGEAGPEQDPAPPPGAETVAEESAAADAVEPAAADSEGDPAAADSEGEPAAADFEGDPAAAEGLSELGTVAAERDQAVQEKAELLDRYQRAQAEFDNLRKRLVREKDEAVNYAAMETIRSLLPVADDFERALATQGLDEEVRKGLDLVYKAMFDVFTRAGLTPIEEEGKFDPNLHHAVDKQPVENEDDDQKVLEVYQRGYHFKERLLRPAVVKVAVKE